MNDAAITPAWESSKTALYRVRDRNPDVGWHHHARALKDLAKSGKVASRCLTGSIMVRDIRGSSGGREHDVGGEMIPQWVWVIAADPNRSNFNADAGSLSGQGFHDGKAVRFSFGMIEFDGTALASLLGATAPPRPAHQPERGTTPRRSSAGGAPRSDAWNDWIAALVLLVHEGDVEAGVGVPKSKTALVRLISQRMVRAGLEEMPDTTVSQAAARVLEALRTEKLSPTEKAGDDN